MFARILSLLRDAITEDDDDDDVSPYVCSLYFKFGFGC